MAVIVTSRMEMGENMVLILSHEYAALEARLCTTSSPQPQQPHDSEEDEQQ
jgi:hypothetical protein